MFPGKLKTLFTLGALVLTAGVAGTAHADASFPNRAVRIISPFSPGGATDVLARVLAHHLNEKWQQSVVVENRAGAGGVIAAQAVARSTPDGYTLLLGSVGPMEVLPSLIKDLPYDPIKDFSPISIKMAKMQGISLNPSEITGMCGRLRCCLVYEYEQYVAARQQLPKRNKRVGTPHGEARVIDVHPLLDAVTVMNDEGRYVVKREDIVPLDELRALEKKAKEPCNQHGDEPCDCGEKPGKRREDQQ